MTPFLIIAAIVITAVLRRVAERADRGRFVFDAAGHVEVGLVFLMVVALVFLGGAQIVLRNFFHSGLIWAEPLMRHTVLWLGCLGGMLATRRLRHINIDVFSRLVPRSAQPIRRFVVYGATAVAAFYLGMAAVGLVADEREFGDVAFLGIKTWVLQSILPVAFFVIAYRSLVNLLLGREPARPEEEFATGGEPGTSTEGAGE